MSNQETIHPLVIRLFFFIVLNDALLAVFAFGFILSLYPSASVNAQQRITESASSTAAGGACTSIGTYSIIEPAVTEANLSFRVCRGDETGCAGSGGNWCSVRVCRLGSAVSNDNCFETFRNVDYGHYVAYSNIDVSEVITSPGKYQVYLCERAIVGSSSELGPCCYGTNCEEGCWDQPDLGCNVKSASCQKYLGKYAYCHLNEVQFDINQKAEPLPQGNIQVIQPEPTRVWSTVQTSQMQQQQFQRRPTATVDSVPQQLAVGQLFELTFSNPIKNGSLLDGSGVDIEYVGAAFRPSGRSTIQSDRKSVGLELATLKLQALKPGSWIISAVDFKGLRNTIKLTVVPIIIKDENWFIREFNDPSPLKRGGAFEYFLSRSKGILTRKEQIELLKKGIADSDSQVRRRATNALKSELKNDDSAEFLRELLPVLIENIRTGDLETASLAAEVVEKFEEKAVEAQSVLVERCRKEIDRGAAKNFINSLASIRADGDQTLSVYREILQDDSKAILQDSVYWALVKLGERAQSFVPLLLELYLKNSPKQLNTASDEKSLRTRGLIINALTAVRANDPKTLEVLVEAYEQGPLELSGLAAQALLSVGKTESTKVTKIQEKLEAMRVAKEKKTGGVGCPNCAPISSMLEGMLGQASKTKQGSQVATVGTAYGTLDGGFILKKKIASTASNFFDETGVFFGKGANIYPLHEVHLQGVPLGLEDFSTNFEVVGKPYKFAYLRDVLEGRERKLSLTCGESSTILPKMTEEEILQLNEMILQGKTTRHRLPESRSPVGLFQIKGQEKYFLTDSLVFPDQTSLIDPSKMYRAFSGPPGALSMKKITEYQYFLDGGTTIIGIEGEGTIRIPPRLWVSPEEQAAKWLPQDGTPHLDLIELKPSPEQLLKLGVDRKQYESTEYDTPCNVITIPEGSGNLEPVHVKMGLQSVR